MKIAIGFRLRPGLEALLVDDNVLYRPDLTAKGEHALRALLTTWPPDVFIARALPGGAVLRSWRAALRRAHPPILLIVPEGAAEAAPVGEDAAGIEIHQVKASGSLEPEVDALLLAEKLHLSRIDPHVERRAAASSSSRRVALVGSGIVNIITAYFLVRAGYVVETFDGGADPDSPYEWTQQGCTFGGGDARIFSLNEGRHHHHKGYDVSERTNTQFQRPIADGGWLSCRREQLSEADRRWIHEFERVPPWLSGRFDRDIISFNQESLPLWRRMMAESPALFDGVGFRDALLRVYPTKEKLERAKTTEGAIGAVIGEVSLDAVVARCPALREAVQAGRVAGALEVEGFSVNVHKLGRRLVSYLSHRGATFHWRTPIQSVERDEFGRVAGLRTENAAIESDHYVFSTGAFGNDLLRGFESFGKIAPVIGMWVTLPDNSPRLDVPLKVAREGYACAGAAEGANVIAGTDAKGRDVIHVSSGHGYIGIGGKRRDADALADLARAAHETARDLFPSKYSLAREIGMIPEADRYCIRPWTPSGLGLFEIADASRDGMAIVTGGHNTGGFAQSPSVGAAVVAALSGNQHPMHVLYHPRRFSEFAYGSLDGAK